jgi:O-methyltransferase
VLKTRIMEWLAGRGVRVITRNSPFFDVVPRNVEPAFLAAFAKFGRLSTAPADAAYALWQAVEYVVRCDVPGDFVECGVFRGGSTGLAAAAFAHFGGRPRQLYLYDTYEGMTAPTARDVDFAGRTPQEHLKTWGASTIGQMANSPIEQVRANVLQSGLPAERFVFVKGRVEETIPGTVPPGPIAILRLDTDWYESTRHELVHLFPRLASGGVLIVDDYGFWKGSRDACDEYFKEHGIRILLSRVDRAGAVMGVKV